MTPVESPIRVLLVDDDPLVLAGLRLLLRASGRIDVVGQVDDGDQVLDAVQGHRPDVVLMDLRMPRMDGIQATLAVRSLPQPPHVIVLTTWDVDDAVVRSIEAGASGFLLKTASPDEIVSALQSVVEGDAVLSPRSTRQLLDQWDTRDAEQRREAESRMAALSQREREVAAAVGEGLTNAQAGRKLFMAEATVKAHISSIQNKVDARNRVMIAVLAERAGLLRP